MVEKILIVEDDDDIRLILDIALRDAGYEVEQMASGKSLLENRTKWPDLVILDKALPNIDGLALCKYLRLQQATTDIPIVMISCYHKLRDRAKQVGVNEFFEKPFELKALLRAIEKNIRKKTDLSS